MSVLARRRLAWLLMHDGQFSQAREEINRVTGNQSAGRLAVLREPASRFWPGRPREALAALPDDNNEGQHIARAMAEYSLGHAAESQRSLDFLLTHHANVWGYQIAQVYAWRGEKDKAFEWLERIVPNGMTVA